MRLFVCFVDGSNKTPPLISGQNKKAGKMEAEVSKEKVLYDSTIMKMRSYKKRTICVLAFLLRHRNHQVRHALTSFFIS